MVYHSISGDKHGVFRDNVVDSDRFEKQIAYLSKKYKIIPLSFLIERLESKKELPKDWVVLTFDDGYKDNLDNVLPVIKKYNASATFYITMDVVKRRLMFFYDLIQKIIDKTGKKAIVVTMDDKEKRFDLSNTERKNEAVLQMVLKTRGKNNEERMMFVESLKETCSVQIDAAYEKEKLYLSEDDLRILQKYGSELASHSLSHANLARMSDRELDEEIVGSKKALETILNSDVNSFSYPFGKKYTYNENVKRIVRRAGYKSALTTNSGKVTLRSDLYELPRFGVRNTYLTRLKINLMGIPL